MAIHIVDDSPEGTAVRTVKRVGGIAGAIVVLLLAVVIWFTVNSSSCSREVTRWRSEYGYGVERVVTLYSATGEQIDQWEGIIDVDYDEYGSTHADLMFFDEDGNVVDRVIIDVGAGTLVVEQV